MTQLFDPDRLVDVTDSFENDVSEQLSFDPDRLVDVTDLFENDVQVQKSSSLVDLTPDEAVRIAPDLIQEEPAPRQPGEKPSLFAVGQKLFTPDFQNELDRIVRSSGPQVDTEPTPFGDFKRPDDFNTLPSIIRDDVPKVLRSLGKTVPRVALRALGEVGLATEGAVYGATSVANNIAIRVIDGIAGEGSSRKIGLDRGNSGNRPDFHTELLQWIDETIPIEGEKTILESVAEDLSTSIIQYYTYTRLLGLRSGAGKVAESIQRLGAKLNLPRLTTTLIGSAAAGSVAVSEFEGVLGVQEALIQQDPMAPGKALTRHAAGTSEAIAKILTLQGDQITGQNIFDLSVPIVSGLVGLSAKFPADLIKARQLREELVRAMSKAPDISFVHADNILNASSGLSPQAFREIKSILKEGRLAAAAERFRAQSELNAINESVKPARSIVPPKQITSKPVVKKPTQPTRPIAKEAKVEPKTTRPIQPKAVVKTDKAQPKAVVKTDKAQSIGSITDRVAARGVSPESKKRIQKAVLKPESIKTFGKQNLIDQIDRAVLPDDVSIISKVNDAVESGLINIDTSFNFARGFPAEVKEAIDHIPQIIRNKMKNQGVLREHIPGATGEDFISAIDNEFGSGTGIQALVEFVQAQLGGRAGEIRSKAKIARSVGDTDPNTQLIGFLLDSKKPVGIKQHAINPNELPDGSTFDINGQTFGIHTEGGVRKMFGPEDTMIIEPLQSIPVDEGSLSIPDDAPVFQEDPTIEAEPIGAGGFAAVPGRPGQAKTVKKPLLDAEKLKSSDEKIEGFFGRTNRLITTQSKLQNAIETLKVGLTERFVFLPHIPRQTQRFVDAEGKSFSVEPIIASDSIRTMAEKVRAAKSKAIDEVRRIIDGDGNRQALSSEGLDLLRRKVFTEDMLVESQRAIDESIAARSADPNISNNDVQRILRSRTPRGITHQSLLSEKARIDALVNQIPSVKDAFKLRTELWERVSQDLADRGIITKDQAKNRHYVRHFVLDFVEGQRSFAGTGKNLKKPFRRYAIRRKGSSRDISTDYLEVELKALGDIFADNAIQDLSEQIAQSFGKKPPSEGGPTIDGYTEWEYAPGNHHYRAKTITDAQIARLIDDAVLDPQVSGQTSVPVSALREALVVGRKRGVFYIPDWLATQLNELPVKRLSTLYVHSLSEDFTHTWKQWILRSNPIRYNLRNAIGDSERVHAAGQTKAFRLIPDAVKLLSTEKSPAAHPLAYEMGIQNGAFGSSLWHEMGSARRIKEFERFKDVSDLNRFKKTLTALSWPVKKVGDAGQWLQDMTQVREDVLRVAVYLKALDDIDLFLKNGTTIRHWAGDASQQQLQALAMHDKYAAAAKISRETLGDYGAFTPWENERLRGNLAPFYSWLKINTTFWPRVAIKATQEGALGKAGISFTSKSARFAGRSIGLGTWLGRVLAMYGAIYLWNHRDEKSAAREKALPQWQRFRPHITLENGVVMSPTALSDFTEWFGVDEILPEIRRFENGHITFDELMVNLMKNQAKAPVNRVFQSLSPFLKSPLSLTGNKTFPDVFETRRFTEAFSSKAVSETVLDILGSDTRRFVKANDTATLRDAFSYYMSGSSFRPLTDEQLIDQINRGLKSTTLKARSRTTGRGPGEAKKGRERDQQLLLERKKNMDKVKRSDSF